MTGRLQLALTKGELERVLKALLVFEGFATDLYGRVEHALERIEDDHSGEAESDNS